MYLHNDPLPLEMLVTGGLSSTGNIHLAFSCFPCSQTGGKTVSPTVLPGPAFYLHLTA